MDYHIYIYILKNGLELDWSWKHTNRTFNLTCSNLWRLLKQRKSLQFVAALPLCRCSAVWKCYDGSTLSPSFPASESPAAFAFFSQLRGDPLSGSPVGSAAEALQGLACRNHGKRRVKPGETRWNHVKPGETREQIGFNQQQCAATLRFDQREWLSSVQMQMECVQKLRFDDQQWDLTTELRSKFNQQQWGRTGQL